MPSDIRIQEFLAGSINSMLNVILCAYTVITMFTNILDQKKADVSQLVISQILGASGCSLLVRFIMHNGSFSGLNRV